MVVYACISMLTRFAILNISSSQWRSRCWRHWWHSGRSRNRSRLKQGLRRRLGCTCLKNQWRSWFWAFFAIADGVHLWGQNSTVSWLGGCWLTRRPIAYQPCNLCICPLQVLGSFGCQSPRGWRSWDPTNLWDNDRCVCRACDSLHLCCWRRFCCCRNSFWYWFTMVWIIQNRRTVGAFHLHGKNMSLSLPKNN